VSIADSINNLKGVVSVDKWDQSTLKTLTMKTRCQWAKSELMIQYHDTEWGVPLHDDRKLFEFLTLDAFQAGLSWEIILKKRENFRKALDNFDPEKISRYTVRKIEKLMKDPGIVRNRLKIESTISNAAAFLEVQREFGSFDSYTWDFAGGNPIVNTFKSLDEIPSSTPESEIMSKDLKKRGFRFVGSTICYAFMQAAGLVNDHTLDCFRYRELSL